VLRINDMTLQHSSDVEILSSLQRLLCVHADNEKRRPEAIVSAAPQVWADVDIGDSLLVNVARVLGVSNPWTVGGLRPSNLRLEELVYQQFLAAGWPARLVQLQYRPDSRSGIRFDIAILSEQGEQLVAVEVPKMGYGHMAAARQFRETTQIPYVCVSDGDSHIVFKRDGTVTTYDQPPTPAQLGISVEGQPQTRSGQQVIRPENVDVLRAVMEEHAPRRLIFDYSLPWGHRIESNAPISQLLPTPLLDAVHGPIESIHVLLAGLSVFPSVEIMSTITTPSLAWAESFRWLRTWLTKHLRLAAHIELPPSVFGPSTTIRPSFFRFDRSAEATYFDSLDNRGDLIELNDRPWFQSYVGWLNGRPSERGFTRRQMTALLSWTVATNDPQAVEIRERIAAFGAVSTLDEVATIRQGRPVGQANTTSDPAEGSTQIIDLRRLRAAWENDEEPEFRYVREGVDIREDDRLRQGDVLLPKVRTRTAAASMFSGEFPAIAAGNVFVLRPNATISSQLIVEFLNSATGKRLLDSIATGGNMPQIQLSGLRTVSIPLVDVDLSEPLKDYEQTYGDLADAASELKSRRQELFDSPNLGVFVDKLHELRRRSNLLSSSLRLAGSLDFQISQLFPFPIAYGYRLLAGYVDLRERFKEQLRVAENLLAFLGSVSLALLTDEDRHSLAEDFREYWKGGISPGDWRAIISRCSGLLREYEDNQLASSLCKLNAGSDKKGLGKELQLLIRVKNDFKHERGSQTEAEILKDSREVQSSLDRCMELLVFWTNHPIRQIRELDVERRDGRFRLQCVRLQGDHPGFRREEIRWHQAFKRGDIYVEIADDYWVPLYPFVQRMSCHHCKAEEIYFIDKWDGNRHVLMKSFERGHTEESVATAEELNLSLPKPSV
jgi:hypothetical protein